MSTAKKVKESIPKSEVKVNNRTFLGTYLAYIANQLESGQDPIIIKGAGMAIRKASSLATLCTHRFKGLHQLTEAGNVELPGRQGTEEKRKVPLVTITLSKKQLNKDHRGYIAPIPESEVQEYVPREKPERPRRGRGRGRGGFGNYRGYGRFGRRGRGRQFY